MRVQSNYQVCVRCIMDTTDSQIQFDSNGLCDYCRNFDEVIKPSWQTGEVGSRQLNEMAEQIRSESVNNDFDCIIGLSGGLDSSYAAYIAKEVMGLKPLLFHVDAGWNTDQAVGNIEKLVDGLGLELYTEVINWEEMKDLQVAMLRSQIPDQDIPQDTAFFSSLYKFARKHRIKHIITGANYSTECCREPDEWGAYPGIDKTLITDIHSKFGKRPLKTFPIVDIFEYKILYRYVYGMKVLRPLNLVPYIKADAEKLLEQKFGWQKFKHKHHESRFTIFFEDYWMPRKFGYHKRRAHFSSLIMTGQLTREKALERISKPEMSDEFWKSEFEYIANKLDLTVKELQQIYEGPNKTYADYKNKKFLIEFGTRLLSAVGIEKRFFR